MKFWFVCLYLIIATGCRKRVESASEFLSRFPSAEEGNEVSMVRNGFRYRLHNLNSDYFCARDFQTSGERSGSEIQNELEGIRKRYGNALYFILRIEPVQGADTDAQYLDFIQEVKLRQDWIARNSILKGKQGPNIEATSAVVSAASLPHRNCSILLAFSSPESSLKNWKSLFIGGSAELPLDVEFALSTLRPRLRFEP